MKNVWRASFANTMNAFGGRGILTVLEHLVLAASENNIIKVKVVKVRDVNT
jgi:hypothetical protein